MGRVKEIMLKKLKKIKKIPSKLKKTLRKWKKIKTKQGMLGLYDTMLADVTYALYDGRAIKRLKKFPPKLVENRILFETNDDFIHSKYPLNHLHQDHHLWKGLLFHFQIGRASCRERV